MRTRTNTAARISGHRFRLVGKTKSADQEAPTGDPMVAGVATDVSADGYTWHSWRAVASKHASGGAANSAAKLGRNLRPEVAR